ncbi:hypothetical protein FRC10_004911 [Ceratobasidium sp. 414]|nr:hypothetical protein FRC10_004911 [Ceratobasidium sp. 414]
METPAMTYLNQGQWGNAETLKLQVLDAGMQTLDKAYGDKAEALQVQVPDATKRMVGERHPDTFISTNSLAMTYSGQGRWDETEALQMQAVDAGKQAVGERHTHPPI